MANFINALVEYNPYVAQIPTDAYVKVGMLKEQQYEAGVAKIQDTVDKVMGLDIARTDGKNYLNARVDELVGSLNKYNAVDFSNPNNVAQLTSLAKPLYQDENIVTDVINTGVYRKHYKDANDSYSTGKMEAGQYTREMRDDSSWLNAKGAGAAYTGRTVVNTSTRKDAVDRLIKAKKDGMDKSEYTFAPDYSIDKPYYIKSTNKFYNEAEFNNFVAENILTSKDREMLMNEHWYENQGRSTEDLQREDLNMYLSKIDANNKEIDRIKDDPKFLVDPKKAEAQQRIDDLTNYNKQLNEGKIDFLKKLNLNDPTSRDLFHRDLGEARFMNSLDILRDRVVEETLQKNDPWFTLFEASRDAAKEGAKTGEGTPKTLAARINEVAVVTPGDNSHITTLSLNTVQTGYQMMNDQISDISVGLIGKLMKNGLDMTQYMQVDSTGKLMWDQTNVGTKGGAIKHIPVWKSKEAKDQFSNMIQGLHYGFSKEAIDGNMGNKSFTRYIAETLGGYIDDDPNSEFKLSDKIVSDALNGIKGKTAILPRLDLIYADKELVRDMSKIDSLLKAKKTYANDYRNALYSSQALSTEERNALSKLSDEQMLSNSFFLDKKEEQNRVGNDKQIGYYPILESDGTYSVYQEIYDNKDAGGITRFLQNLSPEGGSLEIGRGELLESKKLSGGYKTLNEASNAIGEGGQLQLNAGISKESLEKANKFVEENYSYVQEGVVSTVANLKQDKVAYGAVQDGLTILLNRSKLQATSEDLIIDGGAVDPKTLGGIGKVEILGAAIANSANIFLPNPMFDVEFETTATNEEGTQKITKHYAQVSARSLLAANPNFRTSAYAKLFAPIIYAQQDASARIHATMNPLEGSEGSYAPRGDIKPMYQRQNQQGEVEFASDEDTDIAWETFPIERNGKQTMISYQVVSLGRDTSLGNQKNTDKQTYSPGAFYIKYRSPTNSGKTEELFLKDDSGKSYEFGSASAAHYTFVDLIFNDPNMAMDEIDPKTGQPNYFTTNPNTIQGFANKQLYLNGFGRLTEVKMKDAIGRESIKYENREAQFRGTR